MIIPWQTITADTFTPELYLNTISLSQHKFLFCKPVNKPVVQIYSSLRKWRERRTCPALSFTNSDILAVDMPQAIPKRQRLITVIVQVSPKPTLLEPLNSSWVYIISPGETIGSVWWCNSGEETWRDFGDILGKLPSSKKIQEVNFKDRYLH
jgi:hypothetical protein